MRSFINRFCVLLLFVSVAFFTQRADAAPEKINVLLVTGFDVGSHVWEESTRMVQAILQESGRFNVTISSDKEVFASPEIKNYGAVVLCFGYWQEGDPVALQKRVC